MDASNRIKQFIDVERTIYLYHGFDQFEHEKSRLADLEALTLSLPEYMKTYPLTISEVE